MSWTDITEKLNTANDAYNNGNLLPALVATLAGMIEYVGNPRECYNLLKNRLPKFWLNTSTVMAVLSGFLAATYTAYETIRVAVKTEYFNAADPTYVGANYLSYGGVSLVGDFLGLVEVSWVGMYLMLATEIALAPLLISLEYKKHEQKMMDGQMQMSQADMEFNYVVMNFLIAFGAWTSAVLLKESAVRMIGFFDLQNTDGVAVYQSYFSGSKPAVENGFFLLIDLLNHSITSDAFFAIAAVLMNAPLFFVYVSMNPELMEKLADD